MPHLEKDTATKDLHTSLGCMHHVVPTNEYITSALKCSSERGKDGIKKELHFPERVCMLLLPSLVLVTLDHFLNLDPPLFGLHSPLEVLKEKH